MAQSKHEKIERNVFLMIVLTLMTVSVGGLVEIVPLFFQHSTTTAIDHKGNALDVKPYDPVRLAGRDIYVREGCYNCHSQMIRPFRAETERYGHYSVAGESVYDHPFQWGSKRTGPDLAREGGRYPNSWHFNHFMDPSTMSPGSIMPSYMFLIENDLNTANTAAKIKTMQSLGVPYPEGYADQAGADLKKQSDMIAADLKKNGIEVDPGKEVIALIAYMQRLGKDIKASETASR